MRKLGLFFLISVLVCGCSGDPVRSQIESGIRHALPDYIGPAKRYDVHAFGSTTEMIGGKMDKLNIEGDDVRVAPSLVINKLLVEMLNVRFDTRKRTMQSVGSSSIVATVTQDSVNRYIRETRGSTSLGVEFSDEKILVHFKPTVAGVGVALTIAGKAVIESGDKVNFQADAAAVGRMPVPAYVVNKGLNMLNPVLDLSKMQFPVELKSIRIRNGSADVAGTAKFSPAP